MGNFYNGGLWGKLFVICRIQLKFCFWSYKKCWHTSWKFQFEIKSNKKVIAKKPLTNLYEMNSRAKIRAHLFGHWSWLQPICNCTKYKWISIPSEMGLEILYLTSVKSFILFVCLFACLCWGYHMSTAFQLFCNAPLIMVEEDPRYLTVCKGSIKHLGSANNLLYLSIMS